MVARCGIFSSVGEDPNREFKGDIVQDVQLIGHFTIAGQGDEQKADEES